MYHVKLLLKYTVKEQIFYEESILQVDAGSFDEAIWTAFSLMTWKVMYRKCIPESFRIIRSFPKRSW